MYKIRNLEVIMDNDGLGKDVWCLKWAGKDKAQVYRGVFHMNSLNLQHIFTLKCTESMTNEEFYVWAEGVLLGHIEEDAKNPSEYNPFPKPTTFFYL